MTGVTAESFIVKNKYIQKRNPRKHLVGIRKKDLPAPPLYLIDPLELATFGSTFLRGHYIIIHKKVDQSKQIAAMASAMGATLLTEEVHDLTYATDLIICGTEHSVRPRVLQQALERHIRVVSPLWIVSCFREQCYKNPYLFPYHMDNVKNTLKQSEDIDEDPFHINTLAIQKPLVEHDQISEFSASPSLPPSPPPKESKMPKPSKGVSAILNDKVFIASVKRRAPQLLIKGDEQRASTHFKTNKHPRKSTLFERNGLASMYVDKK